MTWLSSSRPVKVASLLLLAGLTSVSSAQGYCRTTTCNPRLSCGDKPEECCILDANGCDQNGRPIAWPTSCVSYNTYEEGSELRGISASVLRAKLGDAFDSWLLPSHCDGSGVSLSVEDRGYSSCGAAEFNQEPRERNANVWMFDDVGNSSTMTPDDFIAIDTSALAVAIVSFDSISAELVDVDVRLNSSIAPFTTSDDEVDIDLASVIVHEAGHFLGLDHSLVSGSTMGERYLPGTIDGRTLNDDDRAGICAIYPEDRTIKSDNRTCEPRGKYSPRCEGDRGCGCATVGSDRSEGTPLAFWGLVTGLFFLFVRRKRTQGLVTAHLP